MSVPSLANFRKSLKGTPMYGEAAAIYDVAMRNGVNPAFVSGLAKAESSYGTAGFARGKYNPYGYGVFKGGPNNGYGSYAAATEAMTKGLRGKLYYGAGKRSIADVMNTYSPPSSNNTGQHIQNIINAGAATGGDASQVFIDGPTGYEGTAGDTTGSAAAAKKALSPFGSMTNPMQTAIAGRITSGHNGLVGQLVGDEKNDKDDEKQSLFKTVMDVAMKQAMQGGEPQSDGDGHEGHDHGPADYSALTEGGVDSGKLVRGGAGGNWGGALDEAVRLQNIAGITPSSQKRSRRNSASGRPSDHWEGSTTSYAIDLPGTPGDGRTDASAQRIVAALGGPKNWPGGVYNVTRNGYRYQVIWKSNVGGNHYDHIHLGVRKV